MGLTAEEPAAATTTNSSSSGSGGKTSRKSTSPTSSSSSSSSKPPTSSSSASGPGLGPDPDLDLSDEAFLARHEGVLGKMRERWQLLQKLRLEKKYAALGLTLPANWSGKRPSQIPIQITAPPVKFPVCQILTWRIFLFLFNTWLSFAFFCLLLLRWW